MGSEKGCIILVTMSKIWLISVCFLFFVICFLFLVPPVHADELGELEQKLADLKHALNLSVAATTPLEKNLDKLQVNLDEIRKKISLIEKQVFEKELQVREGEKLLILAEELLSQKVRQIYKSTTHFGANSLLFIFQNSLTSTLRQFGYQKAAITSDRDTIVKVVLYVKDLEKKKKDLEEEKNRLAKVKEEADKQAAFLQKEISGAKKYQAALNTQIAQLSQRQQELLAQKLASLNLPTRLGAGPLFCTDDRKIDPGFRPAFAFFTYGIPHRVGMNQYGAYGRANAGQDYKTILQAYFDGISFEGGKENIQIKVQGHGSMPLDDYLLGIYEMPENWDIKALKAQAVAARSYALAYTNNGQGEICTTQACQVWKPDKKTGQWKQAVEQTRGEVMVYGGQVIKAWYSSTDGGYTYKSGDVWSKDTAWTRRFRDVNGDVSSFDDLNSRAYDRDSPCFYAAQGFRGEFGKSAWLKSDEVADIVNVLLLAKKDTSSQNHLVQSDRSNPDNVDTWDSGRVKQELRNRGGTPYNNISEIKIEWDKDLGKTTLVLISGDGGNNSFDGNEFKNFFNLRAPANIQIVGPLYNIEKR